MTGGRALSCVLCRILRVIEINRRLSYVRGLRLPVGVACINTKRTLYTSPWLLDQSKDTEQGSSSSSSSDDSSGSSSSSDDSSGSDTDSETKDVKSSQTKVEDEGENDIMSLLSTMRASEEKWGSQENVKTNLKKIEPSIDKELVTEAIELSKVLPGKTEESENNLLSQLLSQFETTENQKQGEKPAKKVEKAEDIQKAPEIGEPVKSETDDVSNMLAQFRTKGKETGVKSSAEEIHKEPGSAPSLSSVLEQMRVGQNFDNIDEGTEFRKRIKIRHSSRLFKGKPLGIFTKDDIKATQSEEKKSLFDVVEQEERDDILSYPPSNAFEEQIQWTREGKLWTFPIDNEAGWEEESNIEFYEHVFLDDQLMDFPKKGPIRHFMELVTVALSKNPYLTVTQKHEHIDWYRNYFRGKYDILEPTLGQDGVIQSQASQ